MEQSNVPAHITEMPTFCLPMMPDITCSSYSLFDGGFIFPNFPHKDITPYKRGPGRPKLYTRSRDGTPVAARTPKTAGSDGEAANGIKKKRKYTRREKCDSVRLVSDIAELTEHIADLLNSSTKSNESEVDFGDLNFQDLESSQWRPHKIQYSSDQCVIDQNEEDVANFNDLIDEWSDETKRRQQRAVNTAHNNPASKHRTPRSVARPNTLNCRRKALNGVVDDIGRSNDVDSESPSNEESLNTWNYRIGGKCTNKWQLFEKHVLENNVARQLREKRLTDRLIKVLSSTPQRKLRPRKSSEKMGTSNVDVDDDIEIETSSTHYYSTNDTRNNDYGENHLEFPATHLSHVGGYCPDIEPTLNIWPGPYARPVFIYQRSDFSDRTTIDAQSGKTPPTAWHFWQG